LVKRFDYKNKKFASQDIIKELKLVDFVEGKSATQTISKIQEGE